MAEKCEICAENESKYKCPKCIVLYCSVACFKSHKQQKCSPVEKKQETSKPERKPLPVEIEAEQGEDDWRLSATQLKQLEDSEQVHKHLENPLIRDIAKLIDSSENPEQDLMGARDTHPEFEDFVRSLVKATRKKQQQQH